MKRRIDLFNSFKFSSVIFFLLFTLLLYRCSSENPSFQWFHDEKIGVRICETKMQKHVLAKILKHLTNKSLDYHANKMSGGIVSDASKLSNSIENFWDTITWTAVPIITTITSICIALSFFFWQYAIILAVLSIVVIYIVFKSQNSMAEMSKLVAKKSSAMTAYFADVITNIATVKAFSAAK